MYLVVTHEGYFAGELVETDRGFISVEFPIPDIARNGLELGILSVSDILDKAEEVLTSYIFREMDKVRNGIHSDLFLPKQDETDETDNYGNEIEWCDTCLDWHESGIYDNTPEGDIEDILPNMVDFVPFPMYALN